MATYASTSSLKASVRGTSKVDFGLETPAAWRFADELFDGALDANLRAWYLRSYLHPTVSTVRLDFSTPNADGGAGANNDILGLPLEFSSLKFVAFRNLYRIEDSPADASVKLVTSIANSVSWLDLAFETGQQLGPGGGFAFKRTLAVSETARYIDVEPQGSKAPWFRLLVLGTVI